MNDIKIDPKKIKKMVESLLDKIDSDAQISVLPLKDGVIGVDIKTADAQILIGLNGETLRAIAHLLRVMARKAFGENVFIEVDVNDWLKKRRDYLRQMAISSADDAALAHKEIVLPPMNSYERRIVHMELFDRRDVSTESRGYDPERRVVIKPAE